eukprot:5225503-Alexandrium_andersonii.AAC.1
MEVLAKRFDVLIPRREELIKRLNNADSAKEQYDTYKEIRALDAQIERTKKPLAFAGKSDSDRLFRVAQYEDEWVDGPNGSFRS